jgi:23S rRNA (uracil1939-C5)-methyltransferase
MDEIGLSGFVAEPENGWGRVRAGKAVVHHTWGEYRWQQSVGSFFQANRFLLPILIEEAVPRKTVVRAFDLFCGVGFFTLPLSKIADTVVGVERSLSAVKDARANAKQSGRTNIRFEHGDAASFLDRETLLPSDFVLLDPPREGLGEAIIDRLGKAELDELRYVSCDPAAFARDAALLSRRGYVLERLSLVDLFPNTHHFEIASRWTARSTPRT